MKFLTFSRSTQLTHTPRISGSSKHAQTVRRACIRLTLIALPVLLLALTLMPRPIATAQDTACDLDATFGNGGKVTTSFPGGIDEGRDVAVQTDGKIVVGGLSGDDFALTRYNPDGSLDQTFGVGGRVRTDFPLEQSADAQGVSSARALVIQPDGKILLAGWAHYSQESLYTFALVRYNTDGSLDSSFDGDGRVVTTFPRTLTFHAFIADMALQPDGKIVVVGSIIGTGKYYESWVRNHAMARYNPDGSPDTTFGTGGQVRHYRGLPGLTNANAVALQTDGKIVLAGTLNDSFMVERFNADGSLDNSFDVDGQVITAFGGSQETARALAIQPDGKIVALGWSNGNFALARYNPDGSLDNSFDSDGKVITAFTASGFPYLSSLAIEPDGQIVAASSFEGNSAIVRYNPDGSLDNSFDSDGKILSDSSGGSPGIIVSAVTLQTDGKIVAAGHSIMNGQRDFGVARYNTDGSPDNSFDTDGQVTTDFLLRDEAVSDLLLQSDGRIIAVGASTALPHYSKRTRDNSSIVDFQLARYNPNGSLDATFGTGGLVSTDFADNSDDFAHAAALQTDGKIVVVGHTRPHLNGSLNADGSVAVARYNSDGSLDKTFGTGGKVNINFSTLDDIAYAVAVQPDGRIVLAGTDSSDFLLVRLNADGSLDSGAAGDPTPADSFGTGGRVVTDFNGRVDSANGVIIQTDGKIVAAGGAGFVDSSNSVDTDFALARYNTDGSLDANFGTGGKITTEFGGAGRTSESIEEIVIQPDGKIVAAGFAGGMLARYNADGSLDANFGTGGKVTSDFCGYDTARDLVLDANGKIVVAGRHSDSSSGLPSFFAVRRYNPDGSPDTTFCTNGRTTTRFFDYFNEATAILIHPDGRIIAGGVTNSGSSYDFALARYGTPAPEVVQFARSVQSVGEGAGSVTITVTRTGEAGASASVDYATKPETASVGCAVTTGIASERCDFSTTLGTLSFAAGELSKTITVPLIDDGYDEGAETFQLQLSNASGRDNTMLGAQNVSTITINDNDAAGSRNPIITAGPSDYPFFVRQQYLDFLSREPEPSEPWTAVLNRCANVNTPPSTITDCDRIAVSGAFFGSPEFRVKGFYVFRFYKVAFNRLPEYAEIVTDMSFVAGATETEVYARKAQLATAFAVRPVFMDAYSSKMNAEYVATLLGRYQLASVTTPDPSAPDGATKITLSSTDLVNGLNTGTLTRAQVLRAIADSDEVGVAEYNSAFVAVQYYGYLRRTPEESGYQAWLRVINQDPNNVRIMINGFMNSTEYRLRFGRP